MKKLLCAVSLALGVSGFAMADGLDSAINGAQRTADYQARDQYRHPKQTLEFFGIKPDMTVVEISPGGGWYTEILAPYLKDSGTYYAAGFDPESEVKYYQNAHKRFSEKLAANPDMYGKVQVSIFQPPAKLDIAPAGSADMVLTFRNVHNWYMNGGEENVLASFKAFAKALKPGGVLGVVEHRLPADRPASDQDRSGYMHQAFVVRIAEQAGFTLAAESDVNANPKDTADHPKGVWTLPPSLRLGEEDKAKYQAIGESDRMTLKFVKK
ncbi:class I SAM-dependent methyltransferase [Bowmanella sp. Y57]|uniref:Class I SAM-dependent methyltransferase n=2 Tax=Bowmanella yangjiangensis TaxID=2811230 RepID=A0ABS3CQI1_9ALTE|nr:methyltransferase domain-containing protein [Bowmanella yangjiangensis]MBN7818560.1 class I SAM-dependent methyltransferase [Bowmanella yangjiangensis]